MPVYELVVGKNGPTLTESAAEPPEAAPPMPNSPLTTGADGFPDIPPGRGGAASMNGQVTNRVVRGAMAGLAAMLSREVGRPVLDKTGLTGRYGYVLKYVMRAGMPSPPPGPDGAMPAEPEGPTMATAIQEQLGLRLEASKGRVEVYVIDSSPRRRRRICESYPDPGNIPGRRGVLRCRRDSTVRITLLLAAAVAACGSG